jgi:predicted nucleic acid-binding protein
MTAAVAIADTSALLAVFNRSDAEHSACVAARAQIGHLVVSPLVLAELDYLVSAKVGADAALAVLGHIMDKVDIRRYEVPAVSGHLRAASALMAKYKHLNIGLTDAMNAALAAGFRTNVIFSLDRRHFRAVRPLTGQAHFRLLPDDVDDV